MSTSVPSTERAVVVPVTVPGEAAAAVATVGACSVTVTVLLPLTPPLVAVTGPVAEVLEAVSSPEVLMLPTLVNPVAVDQVKAGWVAMAALN